MATKPAQSELTAPSKLESLLVHTETIKLAMSQLIKSLEARDPQQNTIIKSSLVVLELLEE